MERFMDRVGRAERFVLGDDLNDQFGRDQRRKRGRELFVGEPKLFPRRKDSELPF